MLSRLLIVLEATAAYGRTIPAEISASMQAGVAALDARLAKIGTATGTKDAEVAEFRAALNDQFSTFAASLPLEQNRESLDAVNYFTRAFPTHGDRLQGSLAATVSGEFDHLRRPPLRDLFNGRSTFRMEDLFVSRFLT